MFGWLRPVSNIDQHLHVGKAVDDLKDEMLHSTTSVNMEK